MPKKMTITERLQKSWYGFIKVAIRLSSGHRSKLAATSLLSMHKGLVATDFDHRLVAMVFWKSPTKGRAVADQFHQ